MQNHTEETSLTSRRMFSISICLFIGIPCVCINAFVFIILITKRALRQNTYHFLVLLLSICDFLVGLGYISYAIQTNVSQGDRFNMAMCVIKTFFFVNGTLLSLLQTFLIGLQRYLIICRTSWSDRLFQNGRKYIVCISSWLTILIFTVGLMSPPDGPMKTCQVQYIYQRHFQIFINFNKLLVALLVVTVGLYCVTLRYVIKQNRVVVPKPLQKSSKSPAREIKNTDQGESSKNESHNNIKKSEIKLNEVSSGNKLQQPQGSKSEGHAQLAASTSGYQKMAVLKRKKVLNTVVLLGILLCCLIILTSPLIMASIFFDEVPDLYLFVAGCCCGINSIINPVLYCLKIESVRSVVKDFLCRCA